MSKQMSSRDLVVETWVTPSRQTQDGQVVSWEHKKQVLYGQELPCMLRWILVDTGEEGPWLPCPEC